MARKASIRDVAEKAGVSVGTVSHYLNGRAVSKERTQWIEKAIRDLGFSSNLLARGMRTQQPPVVGLCVPFTTFSNFSELVDELEQKVSEATFEVMQVLSRHDPELEMKRIQRLAAYKVRGLLLVPSLSPGNMLDYLDSIKLPTVILNRVMPDESRFDQVGVDHRGQMREVGRGLIRRGHRSILFVVRFPSLNVTIQRVEGLRDAIAECPDNVELDVCSCGDDPGEYGETLIARMKGDAPPTALVLSNSNIAAWSIASLRGAGARPDVDMLTLDSPNWVELVDPPLSFIRQPNRNMAALAWQCLSNRIENPDEPAKTILFNAKIEWRTRREPS